MGVRRFGKVLFYKWLQFDAGCLCENMKNGGGVNG
jgi:hypothetical protein